MWDEPERLAWLVGLFDADGSLHLQKPHGRLYLEIDMTDADILDKIQQWFGGKRYGPYDKNNGKGHNVKMMYAWRMHTQDDVWNLVDKMYPYLSARRKTRIDEIRAIRSAWVERLVV